MQAASILLLLHRTHGQFDAIEGATQPAQKRASRCGQLKPMMPARQQDLAQLVFELANLPAYRTLRNVEYMGRSRETALSGGDFKNLQGVERGHSAFHGSNLAFVRRQATRSSRVQARSWG
jgi:hypothetical protein